MTRLARNCDLVTNDPPAAVQRMMSLEAERDELRASQMLLLQERDEINDALGRYREALELIAKQGTGRYDHDRHMSIGDTGVKWEHWATIAERALDKTGGDDA